MKAFYQVANGLTVAWVHKKNPAFKRMKPKWQEGGVDASTVLDDDFRPNGLINILGLQSLYYGVTVAEFRPYNPEDTSILEFDGKGYARIGGFSRQGILGNSGCW
jgi:hypothetical protein